MNGNLATTPELRSEDRDIRASVQLLVEGRVPEMFFRQFVKAAGFESAIDVRTFGSISDIKTYLEMFCAKPAFKEEVRALGIIRDAETKEAASAFQSVQATLRTVIKTAPTKMAEVEGNPLRVGVFILPDCKSEGMLETLCLRAAAEDERAKAVLPCVDDFFACLSRQKKMPRNSTKASFAGYALAHDVIDPQLGRAAQKGAIPWDASAFEPLRRFLAELIRESP